MNLYPVILCGGAGTRLWPLSRPSRPKPFIALAGEKTLFRQTLERAQALPDVRGLYVVANRLHADSVRAELASAGADARIILEPEGRDSGPAIAAAALLVARQDPDGIVVILPSDHYIVDAEPFGRAMLRAITAAQAGSIVTLGLAPSGPSTSYGYILPGAEQGGVRRVEAFVEKPDLATAQAYVQTGHLWNSGMFVASAATLVEELRAHAPELAATVAHALDAAQADGAMVRLGPEFSKAPKISFDYAVMERTSRAAVTPTDMAWSDLGAWEAVWAAAPKDAQGVARVGDVELTDVEDAYVYRGEGAPLLVAAGVKGVAIIVDRDAILVCDLRSPDQVKRAVDRLKAAGRPETDLPRDQASQSGPQRGAGWLTAVARALGLKRR